jgi:protein-disulfide isomerase
MLALATRLASAGANNVEIGTQLNRYYAGFAPAERTSLTVDDAMCRGPKNARVTVVEFSDFECPYCRVARPLLEGLASDAGQVRLCFKPFPLKVHAHAEQAAQAAYYAKAQGKFWPMRDALFDHQDALELEDLKRYATELGLDSSAMAEAVGMRAFGPQVEASKAEGKQAAIKGTPSIFINGRRYELPMDSNDLVHAIDDELEWQSNGGKWSSP